MKPGQIIVLILGIALLVYAAIHKITPSESLPSSPSTPNNSLNTSSAVNSSDASHDSPTSPPIVSNDNKNRTYLTTYQTIRFDSGEGLRANEYALAGKRRNGAQLYYVRISDIEKIEALQRGESLVGDIRTTADPEQIAGKTLRKASGEIYYRESIQDGVVVREEISKKDFDTKK